MRAAEGYFIAVLCIIMMAACGAEQGSEGAQRQVQITSPIVWEGTADQDPELWAQYKAVEACLYRAGVVQEGHVVPYVYVLEGKPEWPAGTGNDGLCERNLNIIYLWQGVWKDSWIFGHEAIHIIANWDNSAHANPIFQECQYAGWEHEPGELY